MKVKPALILVPGLLSDETVWHHQVTHLQDIVEPIVPEIGKCQSLQEIIASILAQAPEKFALAGHSMGGWLALEIMRHHRDRVTKLCLIDTSAELDSIEKTQHRLDMLEQVKLGNIHHVLEQIKQNFVYQKAVEGAVKEMFLRNQHSFIRQEKIMLARQTCTDFLPELSLPTLLIVGAEDKGFYAAMMNIQKALPTAKLAVIEKSGHMTPMEAPEAVTSLMRDWLESFYS